MARPLASAVTWLVCLKSPIRVRSSRHRPAHLRRHAPRHALFTDATLRRQPSRTSSCCSRHPSTSSIWSARRTDAGGTGAAAPQGRVRVATMRKSYKMGPPRSDLGFSFIASVLLAASIEGTRRTPQHTLATTKRRLGKSNRRPRLVRFAKQSLGSRSALHKKRLVGRRAGAAGCAEIENQIGPGHQQR